MESRGFPPIEGPDARVLILGSLPGQESLRRREYYAKPENAFWRIMESLVGAGPDLAYADRVAVLERRRIAVWDVCESAYRAGSLDTAIDGGSVVANDFAAFFARQPSIRLVCFNGAKAEKLFEGKVLKTFEEPSGPTAALPRRRLPSTSPANASRSFADKLAAWRIVAEVAADAREPDRAHG